MVHIATHALQELPMSLPCFKCHGNFNYEQSHYFLVYIKRVACNGVAPHRLVSHWNVKVQILADDSFKSGWSVRK